MQEERPCEYPWGRVLFYQRVGVIVAPISQDQVVSNPATESEAASSSIHRWTLSIEALDRYAHLWSLLSFEPEKPDDYINCWGQNATPAAKHKRQRRGS